MDALLKCDAADFPTDLHITQVFDWCNPIK